MHVEYVFTPHNRNYNSCACAKASDQTPLFLKLCQTLNPMLCLHFGLQTKIQGGHSSSFTGWQRMRWEGGKCWPAWRTVGGRQEAGWSRRQFHSFSARIAEEGLMDSRSLQVFLLVYWLGLTLSINYDGWVHPHLSIYLSSITGWPQSLMTGLFLLSLTTLSLWSASFQCNITSWTYHYCHTGTSQLSQWHKYQEKEHTVSALISGRNAHLISFEKQYKDFDFRVRLHRHAAKPVLIQ